MKKPNSIRFILSASKILSVNALYGAKLSFSGAKPFATMYKKSDARKMEEYIKEQVRILDIPNKHLWINKKTLFKLNFTVIFKSGYLLRDLDNCCKNLIDGIWRAMGLNDSHIVEIQCEKTLCKEFPEEKILVEISEYVGEPRFDVLKEDKPIPSMIFLGGTCAGDKWRDKLIPALKKKGFEYFNPVVSDWTPDCIEKENLMKNEYCDSHLYVLTPAMKGVYSVAEIINSAWEVKEHNFGSCIVGILGTKEEWGEGQWRSIEATVKLLKNIGGESPKIVARHIEDPCELLDCYGKPKRKKNYE
jgi:Holliday junction resolvase RusA-like endonuclease